MLLKSAAQGVGRFGWVEDAFGEKALVENRDRYADIICLTDCQLYSLSREAFEAMFRTSSPLPLLIWRRKPKSSSRAAGSTCMPGVRK